MSEPNRQQRADLDELGEHELSMDTESLVETLGQMVRDDQQQSNPSAVSRIGVRLVYLVVFCVPLTMIAHIVVRAVVWSWLAS